MYNKLLVVYITNGSSLTSEAIGHQYNLRSTSQSITMSSHDTNEWVEELEQQVYEIKDSLKELIDMMRRMTASQIPPPAPPVSTDPLIPPVPQPPLVFSTPQDQPIHQSSVHISTPTEGDIMTTVVNKEPGPSEILSEVELLRREVRKLQHPTLSGAMPVKDLCFYPGGQLPSSFRLPEFNKYNGKTCPRTHLKIYCNDMFELCGDEKLMIQLFHKSLTGDALHWYSNLDLTAIRSWEEFSQTFLQHFNFNLELLPKRADLKVMSQHPRESLLEYAYRWRQMASRLQTTPPEAELILMFVKTLGTVFQRILIAHLFHDFSSMVSSASRIERGIKEGIIVDKDTAQRRPSGDRRNEVNTVAPPPPQNQRSR